MKIHLDIGIAQLKKTGEELCGDTVEIQATGNSKIVALSDGLGSGVKANILSQLTAKTASTMLQKGGRIEEVIETLGYTLPVCKVRHLAYSTFTILQVFNDGRVYLAEYDNPEIFWLRGGKICKPPKKNRLINEKNIAEANFNVNTGDWIVMISDGVLHAGLGEIWNLGWGWERVSRYLEENLTGEKSAAGFAGELSRVCNNMYGGKPGDDTSIVVVKVRNPRRLTVLAGPPADKKDDPRVVDNLMKAEGQKVVCGGTTGNMVGRHLGVEVEVDLESNDRNVPPTGIIPGVELTTEGTMTLAYTLEYLRNNVDQGALKGKKDGASKLTLLLLQADTIHFIIGTAINPAQLSPEVPAVFAYKQQIIKDIMSILRDTGKEITEEYY